MKNNEVYNNITNYNISDSRYNNNKKEDSITNPGTDEEKKCEKKNY